MAAITFLYPPGAGVEGEGPPAVPWRLVFLDGEIDLATAPAVNAMLSATAAELDTEAGIVVDVSHVEFIDSTGLTALIAAQDHLRSTGHDLILHSPSPPVTRMLDLFATADRAGPPDSTPQRPVAC